MATTDTAKLETSLEHERLARIEAERIADETIRDLYERQCENQLIRAVAFAANDARSLETAMRAALEVVCRHAGWRVGHVFFVDESQRLRSSDIWHDEGNRFSDLRTLTEATDFGPGVGLPGRVLAHGIPVWIEDITELKDMPPVRRVNRFGLRALLGVPVLIGTQVRAVLELFSDEPRPLDGHFVDLMHQVGTILGRVIERDDAQRELHTANRRLTDALVDLRAAQERIVQQERLRALGQMASGIAHDFNNALHPIVGYAELLLEQPQVTQASGAADSLRTILTSATDAAAVVSRLRDFYRTREDQDEPPAPVDLNALVQQVVELTRPRWYNEALAKGVRIAVKTELDYAARVLGHAPELREAIINLILNAVDSLSHSGTIVLRTRVESERVAVEVSDDGVGMTEDVRRQCLDPFFTTKGERGSGLGLGMVYGIVRRHQGTLEIASAPGRGTTMTLGFPAIGPEQAAPAAPAPARTEGPLLQILVVDDQPSARDVMKRMLEAAGHRVLTAVNGIDAIARLKEMNVELVITDRAMPKMGGDELASIVKQMPRRVPVIMVTGFGVLMTSAGEVPPGVDLVVPKPVTRAALLEAIARVQAGVSSGV